MINQHPADAPLSVLVGNLVKLSIEQCNRPPRKALLFVLKKFIKNTENDAVLADFTPEDEETLASLEDEWKKFNDGLEEA